MKKNYVFGLLFLSVAFLWAGCASLRFGGTVQHNFLTNTNNSHQIHVEGYQGPCSLMGTVTNQWAGDDYYCTDTGIHFTYKSTVPAPTPANGTGAWVPYAFNGTATNTWTSTSTWTPTITPTPTNTATDTATATPTNTATNTATSTATNTGTPTGSPTPTPTSTPVNSYTPTKTPTNTATATATNTGTNTATSTITNTPTVTPTFTLTPAATMTPPVTSSVIFNGFDASAQTPTITVNAGQITVITTGGFNSVPQPGDFVSFSGFSTSAANNVLWPVVNTNGVTIVCQTNLPSITLGSPIPGLVAYGNFSRNLQLIKQVSAATGIILIVWTDVQVPSTTGRYAISFQGAACDGSTNADVTIPAILNSTTYTVGVFRLSTAVGEIASTSLYMRWDNVQ